jgi:hypothetical protein
VKKIRDRKPRPIVDAVLRGVISGTVRIVLDWLIEALSL